MNFKETEAAALGRWHDILLGAGIADQYLSGKHGPCPICGGQDRFRFDNRQARGDWICSSCGAGDGFSLISRVKKLSPKDAKDLVIGLIPKAGVKAVRDRMPDDKAKMRAKKFWSLCESVSDTDSVDKYLVNRLGKSVRSNAIRIGIGRHIAAPERVFPIMASRVDDENGNIVSIHRTYLNEAGRKADVSPVKVLMAGTIPTGSAIRLFSSITDEMGIAEGVETALAAFLLTGIPTWSAVSAPLLKSFNPPLSVKKLTIFSDNDENFTGQAAAYDLARRLVMSRKIEVDVRVPVIPGTDFLDQMRGSDEW